MIKFAITLLVLVVVANSWSFEQFYSAREQCKTTITQCQLTPLLSNQKDTLSEDELQCAKDLERSNVCFYGYSQCMPKDIDAIGDEIPLFCWACYSQLPSQSLMYAPFVQCIQESLLWESKLLVSVAMLLLLVILA